MKRVAVGMCLALLAGCGLPLSGGVHEPGQVPAEERGGGDIQVLPPGPRDDASATDIVRDYFGAQSSPDDAHASAREFLAPEIRTKWRDNASVGVLDADGLKVASTDDPNNLRVTGRTVADIAADGSYTPGLKTIDFEVQVRRAARGPWLITNVPDGLLLTAADRDRSFRARNIYFLAPPSAPGAAPSHVVPDQVFLPVTADNADGLVRRLLAGPSRLLGDSVSTAFPKGTTVRGKVRTNTSGLVTVDLSAEANRASALQREQMSAQLVWSLRVREDFSHLRLLSAGRPLPAGSGGQAVDRERNDWQPYDPDGLPAARVPLYYIGGRRLRVLDGTTSPAADASQRQVVDSAAASPRGGGLALIARSATGSELRTGPLSGPFLLRVRAASLSFPSWGSGEAGVWYLQNGRVMLAPLSGPPLNVPVDDIARFGPIAGVRVSRDGARVGLIAGVGRGRRLLVGRVAERSGALRIVGVHGIAPNVEDVRDLTWDSATSLIALGLAADVVAPVRAAVDGSFVVQIARIGFAQGTRPVSVAAAPNQDPVTPRLVVAALDGAVPVLYRAFGANRYVREPDVTGTEPFYPG